MAKPLAATVLPELIQLLEQKPVPRALLGTNVLAELPPWRVRKERRLLLARVRVVPVPLVRTQLQDLKPVPRALLDTNV